MPISRAIFRKHYYNFAQVILQFIKRGTLAVSSGEAGYVAHEQSGVGITFHNGGICLLHSSI